MNWRENCFKAVLHAVNCVAPPKIQSMVVIISWVVEHGVAYWRNLVLNAGQSDSDKAVFMAFFWNILPVDIRWYKLVGHVVLLDGLLEICRFFFLKDVVLGLNAAWYQSIDWWLVHMHHFRWGTVHCGLHANIWTVHLNHNNYVFVTLAWSCGEPSCLLAVDFCLHIFVEVKYMHKSLSVLHI